MNDTNPDTTIEDAARAFAAERAANEEVRQAAENLKTVTANRDRLATKAQAFRDAIEVKRPPVPPAATAK